jgi:hypothetical protein
MVLHPIADKLYMFGKCVQVDLLCPSILLTAVDTPAADKLCGHHSSYSVGVQHVTCSCDVPFSDLDDPNFACHSVTWDAMHEIATSGSQEECAAVGCPNTIVTMHLPAH